MQEKRDIFENNNIGNFEKLYPNVPKWSNENYDSFINLSKQLYD